MKELDEIRKEIKDVSVKIADVQREQCRIERMFAKASEQKPAHKWEDGKIEKNITFVTSATSGWKVGDMAVTKHEENRHITIIFNVDKIKGGRLYRNDGYSFPISECRHLVSMQVEGEPPEVLR